MTNILDQIAPKIVARGMMSFREQAIMPRLVNADFSAEAARKGDRIEVMIPEEVEVEDVVPGVTNPSVPDKDPKTATIELNQWKKVSFYLSDKDMMQIDADQSFVPFQMQQAVNALAQEVNKSFYKEIMRARYFIGYPGKKLFTQSSSEASKDYAGINPVLEGRKLLNNAKAPKSGRYGILGFEEEANALELPQFADVEKSGDTSVRLEGEIGRKYGIQWFATDQIHTHTSDTLSKEFQLSYSVKTGDALTTVRNISPHPAFGDLALNASGSIVATFEDWKETKTVSSYTHSLSVPFTNNFSNTYRFRVGPEHNNNMIFQRDAFAFAIRPLSSATESLGLGNRIMSVTDPETGLSIRLEISREYKRTVWEFDVLWGVKLVRPEFAVRVLS